ncbi:MAG: hypothetical protein QM692_05030 [Thermomicrobiales bacterium]
MNRYGAYIDYVQVWDRPNDPAQWGGVAATPDQYVGMLAPAFNAIRTANGTTQVILAEFDDRNAAGVLGDDVRFLRGVYDVGGALFRCGGRGDRWWRLLAVRPAGFQRESESFSSGALS